MTFADQIIKFLSSIKFNITLPEEFEVMNPYQDREVLDVCTKFYSSFYSDHNPRVLIMGINPGRFGAGITGITFTDPIRLETECAISNPWPKKQELSSVFIYDMIREYGGTKKFYERFYVSAVSPLGFLRRGNNVNYYDDRELKQNIKPFVKNCLAAQLAFGINRKTLFCLGEGKNFAYLSGINDEIKAFDSIVPLPHPRFIMQYKLRKKKEYIQMYLNHFNGI